jgi:2-methylcitrate dehydratase PrpD
MMGEVARKFGEFIINLRYSMIPDNVIEYAKMLTLKTIAGMVTGSTMRSSMVLSSIIKDKRLPEEVGVIGSKFKTILEFGAFLNTFFAHRSELEDCIPYDGSGWDITVIPAALAVAQKLKLPGEKFLESVVGGLEIHTRSCMFPVEHMGLGIIPPAIGSAATIAKAMDLNVQQILWAFGLALSGNAMTQLNFGFDAHFFESALHPLQGILAAQAAKENLTGNPAIETYLCQLLSKEEVNPEKMIEGLGEKWRLKEIWVKKYPCCFLTHRQIDGLRELMKAHSLSYEQVDYIETHLTGMEKRLLDRPDPKSEADMQFSLQHLLAVVLLEGNVDFRHLSPDALHDVRLQEARKKIRLVANPEWPNKSFGGPARVIIKLKDGRVFTKERLTAVGSTQEPLTIDEIKELFRKFTNKILNAKTIDMIIDLVMEMEKLPNIDELMDLLTFMN